jgi:hypothetical protein
MINLNSLSVIGGRISGVAGRAGLVLSKRSPEILMGLGIVGAVTSTVLACKATLKLKTVAEESDKEIAKIKFAHEEINDPEVYSEKEYMTNLSVAYVQKAVNIGKLYALPVAVGAVSVACLVSSHHILNTRSAAFLGAYTMVDEAFKAYKKRVVDAIGPEKEALIRMGGKEETTTETVVDENGKKRKVSKTVQNFDGMKPEDYSRVFAFGNPYYQENIVLNEAFLKCKENFFNDKLIIKGHVVLNEVLEALGFPQTDYGMVVGWVNDGHGDDFIDFGMTDPAFYMRGEGLGVNGYKKDMQMFYLNFNVDGNIFKRIN